ncbi:MAG: AarF/UbiB family protein, partial [Nanoarchaeota archaeon]
PFHKQVLPVKPLNDTQRQAIALRKSFERLGPTFQKLGQLLSLRPDLVPVEYCAEFEKLQDHVPPFSFEDVKHIIEEDFQKPLRCIFPAFEQKPLASATIAQVHKAKLISGEIVAVKVQRPDIKDTIDADLDILFHLAEALEAHFPELRKYHPLAVVKEFALWTRKELDFELEGRNALRLQEELKENHQIIVPKIYTTHSSLRVLTMDYIEGIKMDNLAGLKRDKINSKKISLLYFTSILQQALLYGFFHADPHPANIYVTKQGKLVYFDFGIMGELPSSDRTKIIRFIRSIPERNADKSIDIIISLAQDTSQANIPAFKEETRPILREVYYNPVQKRSIGKEGSGHLPFLPY